MKGIISALAAATLLVSPLTATAQSHGGHVSGGGGHAGGHGGFHGGGWGGGWHGGYRGGGGYFPFFAGFGLGLAVESYPWYGWGPYAWGPYGWNYDDDYDGPPPPPPGANPPPQVCGAWQWRADVGRYVWAQSPCAPPEGAPPPPPPQG